MKRVAPPTLLVGMPPCPVCGVQTTEVFTGYRCESCRITWSWYGDSAVWDEPDADQCTAQHFVHEGRYNVRCVRAKGHAEDTHGDGIGHIWWGEDD